MGKKIMLQGTASNVGKSIITTGLCRIFKQDGYNVIPFKSQNMALNSFITKEGLEMGRAQVSQAEACGIDPIADMNPILLKPNGNNKSQVIVRGKVVGDMSSKEYHEYKLQLTEVLGDIFEEFEEKYDVVVMEGAGSCAEINLMERDISNMGMAEIADAQQQEKIERTDWKKQELQAQLDLMSDIQAIADGSERTMPDRSNISRQIQRNRSTARKQESVSLMDLLAEQQEDDFDAR